MINTIDYSRCPLTDAFSVHLWEQDRRQVQSGQWLYLCDLDNLKRINDRQGHAAGDRYIKSAVSQLRSVFRRQSDKIYRIGGDEFIVVSDYSPELVLDGVDLPFSIGAAVYDGDIDQSVANADAAMYRQKSQRKRSRRLIDVSIRIVALVAAFGLGAVVV
jgi:GGDEF domain-containing protein